MPGLSQIKKFSSDLLSIGDEITIRASRGEKPVVVPIPKTIEDVNDSEDFVLGMPEKEAEQVVETDDDLSDLAGLTTTANSKSDATEEAAQAFTAPDLSSLINPISIGDSDSDQVDMPDLSDFMDEPQEEEVVEEEEEPKEVSVGDMDLEALLAGGGFDQVEEETAEEPESEVDLSLTENLGSSDEYLTQPEEIAEPIQEIQEEIPELGDDFDSSVLDFDTQETPALDSGTDASLENLGFDDFGSDNASDMGAEDFDASLLEPVSETEDFSSDSFETPDFDNNQTDNFDFGTLDSDNTDFDLPAADTFADDSTGNADAIDDLIGVDSFDDFGAEEVNIPADETPAEPSVSDDFFTPPAEEVSEAPAEDSSFTTDDFDFGVPVSEMPEMAIPSKSDTENKDTIETGESNLNTDSGLGDMFSLDDMNLPDMDDPLPEIGSDSSADIPADVFGDVFADSSEELNDSTAGQDFNAGTDDFGASDFGAADLGTGDSGNPDFSDFSSDNTDNDFGGFDFEDETKSTDAAGITDSSISDFGSLDMDTSGEFSFDEGDDSSETETNEPLEVFDTTDMEGLDFGIQDTDSAMNSSASSSDSFDDFGGDFEIEGFTDVETVDEKPSKSSSAAKSKKSKNSGKAKDEGLDEADFTGAIESDEIPPNALSDAQYKVFRKNLSEYPLNVRLAIENLIVQDEFTDDAEFEVIEKVLNKAPARSVAAMLEKMLDTSIPVPRDYEHRTAAEYEAYKKSVSYQLRNKIIPAFLVGVVALLVCWGLFNFGKNCIYKPLRASSYYKQGYNLLLADEYPQAEMKFNMAVKYRLNKNWFFKYARGYREHKQYQRAASMYESILRCFNHDKAAGLEYAQMELTDLVNYERAEEITRREVLDYHINSADGILMLGDVFLEWGTDKDPEKLELAREQYATLLQLYKPTDLYLSRMMRYYIRSDNLRQVLNMKPDFEGREKSLGWEDWTELSGYLLDKSYGSLSPAEEYLRYEIDGVRGLLLQAVKSNPDNPIAQYNLGRYFILSNEPEKVESTLQRAIANFNKTDVLKTRDIYKYIDSYRLLGEHYSGKTEYLQAQEQYAEGISLYITERDMAGFQGNAQVGKIFEDLGDIKYFISGDYNDALVNYKASIDLENDNPQIRYRVGFIQYKNKNYLEALGSFIKAGEGNAKAPNLMLALANTFSLRGDDYAAQGYYESLISKLDEKIADRGLVHPQENQKDNDTVTEYLYAANNYGVTLYRLAQRTGNSAFNAQAIVQFQQSVRAWDALTRNQNTLVRLGGSNLAKENITNITNPRSEFEPGIYLDIPKTMTENEGIN